MTIVDWNARELALVAREVGADDVLKLVRVELMSKEEAPRGFSALLPETHALICAKGGKNAHKMGVAHEFNSETAKVAGRKGGHMVHAKAREKKNV